MNLVNATKLIAGYTMATDKFGRESLVVVAKGTYVIPSHPSRESMLAEEQAPLLTSDVFAGNPVSSAPLFENDFAPTKPLCDVILNGHCYAPAGRPALCVQVAIKVGSLTKSFNVVGAREYRAGLTFCKPSEPQPFTVLPITYDCAYGGVDRTDQDAARHMWYGLNPSGRGYYPKAAANELNGKAMPNTEELNNPVVRPDGSYRPMAFGPIGRAWQQRVCLAGTYNQEWLDDQFPFLPVDFDERYFQNAPEDQQIPYPLGGEEVVLMHLTPQGRTAFRLPADLGLPIVFFSRDGQIVEVQSVVDTVLLQPDKERFSLVWRASIPLRRNIREVLQVKVGRSRRQEVAERAREERMRGKRHFKSLAELAEWTRNRRQPNGTGVVTRK